MIDLHTHTNHSDGELTTIELLKEAEKNKIEILSITDHNNITAYDDLESISLKDYFSGQIIIGCELEFTKDGRLFDMLGYGFNKDLLKNTSIIKEGMVHATIEGETKKLNQLKEISQKLGIHYSANLLIDSPNHMANDVFLDDIIKYQENKEILDSYGIVDRSSFYRKHYCEPSLYESNRREI